MVEHPDPSQPTEETPPSPSAASRSPSRWRNLGLVLAPALGLAVYFLIPPETVDATGTVVSGLAREGRVVAAVGIAMAVLWLTEALPLAATALMPIALIPILSGGAVSVQAATAPYANHLIFLFMGGFMVALAMQQWGLHRRLALVTIRLVGSSPPALVGGFMLASALLSMWIPNTATTVMMLPIALSVIDLVRNELRRHKDPLLAADGAPFPFAICLLLGMAYAASIGGTGTLIGTPPNLLLASFVRDNYGIELTFQRWLPLGLAMVVVFLPVTWVLLTRVLFPIRITEIPGGKSLIRRQLDELGPISRPELGVLGVFVVMALALVLRTQLAALEIGGDKPLAGLSDSGIAMFAAVLLFALPVNLRKREFLLRWDQALRLPWGILLLFGGGLSLAAAVRSTGVDQFIGRSLVSLGSVPLPLLVAAVTTLVIFLTELTSNTATTATFLPILGATAQGLGIDPLWLVVPMALAASCAFMMPVATPPNAIVFGSGEITIPQMCKAGLWLNLIGITLAVLLVHLLGPPILGIGSR